MKEVRNKIYSIKAEDGAVALPVFQKMEDGNYVVAGTVEVNKLAEIREYLSEYREIAKLIRQNYKKEIADIFYSALGELVGRRGDYSIQTVPIENLGREFTDVQYLSRNTAQTGLPKKTIERILASDGIGVKRYKPGKEIVDLMKNAGASGYMVLPEMSDYGVVVTPDKSTMTISLRFKKFNEYDASQIKNYLLSIADTVENGDWCKRKIEAIFDTSKRLARVRTPYSSEERELLASLGQEAIDLMGVDLTRFKKPTNNKRDALTSGEPTIETDVETPNEENEVEFNPTADQPVSEDKTSSGVKKIVVNGLNNFSQGMNNGQMQIVLSPLNSELVYKIELDGDTLVADHAPEPERN